MTQSAHAFVKLAVKRNVLIYHSKTVITPFYSALYGIPLDTRSCAVGRLRVEWNFLFIFVTGYSVNVLLLAYMLLIDVARYITVLT